MEPGSCTLRPTQWLTVCTICHLASHLGENFQISVFSEHALTIIQIVQEMLLAQDVVLVSGNRELPMKTVKRFCTWTKNMPQIQELFSGIIPMLDLRDRLCANREALSMTELLTLS
jgi:hypothetical protein